MAQSEEPLPETSGNPCQLVRDTAAWLMGRVSHVKVLPEGVEAAADALDPQRLARLVDPALAFDAELHALGPGASEEAVAQYLLVVDALNFCFWPDGPESSADDGQGGDEDSCPGEDEGSAAAAREQLEYEHLARGIKVRPGVEAAGQGRGCCLLAYRWRVAGPAPPPPPPQQ